MNTRDKNFTEAKMKRHLERIDGSIARDMAQRETQAPEMAIVASMAPVSAMLDSTRPRNVLKLVGHSA